MAGGTLLNRINIAMRQAVERCAIALDILCGVDEMNGFKRLETSSSQSNGIQFMLHTSISTYIIILSKHLHHIKCGIATCS